MVVMLLMLNRKKAQREIQKNDNPEAWILIESL
jgi:hypothetical protein